MVSFLFDSQTSVKDLISFAKTKIGKNEILDLNHIEISIIDNNNLDKLLFKIKKQVK